MGGVQSSRQASAEATRASIVAAASRLFFERGYHGAAIDDIAAEAGVAVQTIYNSIGSKRDLLSRVLDYAAAGERAPTPIAEIGDERIEGIDDPREVIASIVALFLENFERTVPVFRVIREAAASDPEVASLERRRGELRLRNLEHPARLLAELGALRLDLTVEDAAAIIFTLGHPDQYRFYVEDLRWSRERWAAWLEAALAGALLQPAP